jgi:hypothetical protein
MNRFIALFAACLSLPAHALPAEINAEYTLSSLGATIARSNETFQRTGDRYSIRQTTQSEGVLKMFLDDSITLESHGRVNEAGLQPLEFDQRRRTDSSRDVHATFDWEKGVLHSNFRGETNDVPLPRATQDRVSILYQFMNLGSQALPQVEMHMSNGRKVELYTYKFVDEVRLATPAGDFDTFHYARVQTGKEPRTEVWLAKDRFNVPVRVIFEDSHGLKIEQMIVALKVR